MTTFSLTKRLSTIKRVHFLGMGVVFIGTSMLLTPVGAPSSITNYLSSNLGIDRLIIGGVITLCGFLMPLLRPYRGLYLACIFPWLLYCIGALLSEFVNHLAATAGIAYSLIYLVLLFEVFDLP